MSSPVSRRCFPRCREALAGIWPLALVLFLLLPTACGRIQPSQAAETEGMAIDLVSWPETPQVGPGSLVITLTDAKGAPVLGAQVQVEANMDHAGMVPVFATAVEDASVDPSQPVGQYTAPITWTMGGGWWVDVMVNLGEGREVSRRVPITVSAGGS